MWRPDTDAWFAGFADGEGCFHFTVANAPAFKIALRADDIAILETLHATFGGSLRIRVKDRWLDGSTNRRPQGELTVSSKRDLARLITYFDRFPLRAKKARDYAIWRRGVAAYCAHGRRGAEDELKALADALLAVREYNALDSAPEVSVLPQLRLAESA